MPREIQLAPAPPEESRILARQLDRSIERAWRVRSSFVRAQGLDQKTPLSILLGGGGDRNRGGRGGAVRLKLFLTILWVSREVKHRTGSDGEEPGYLSCKAPIQYAEMLGLEDPSRNGTRRVLSAIRWLAKAGYVELVPTDVATNGGRERGRITPEVLLGREDGTGGEYSIPTGSGDKYFKIPTSLATNGWLAILSGTALAILLILLDIAEGNRFRGPYFFIRKDKRLRAFSDSTWEKGIAELWAYDLVTVKLPGKDDFGGTPTFGLPRYLANLDHLGGEYRLREELELQFRSGLAASSSRCKGFRFLRPAT